MREENSMANDYGRFGSGSTGYAHYKQAFDRNFGGSGGSGGDNSGCDILLLIAVVVVVAWIILLSM